jgi:uracil-DNA glycosylase
LKAAHPSPFSANKGFFGCKHFSKTNELLIQQGFSHIDWKLFTSIQQQIKFGNEG